MGMRRFSLHCCCSNDTIRLNNNNYRLVCLTFYEDRKRNVTSCSPHSVTGWHSDWQGNLCDFLWFHSLHVHMMKWAAETHRQTGNLSHIPCHVRHPRLQMDFAILSRDSCLFSSPPPFERLTCCFMARESLISAFSFSQITCHRCIRN